MSGKECSRKNVVTLAIFHCTSGALSPFSNILATNVHEANNNNKKRSMATSNYFSIHCTSFLLSNNCVCGINFTLMVHEINIKV